jgi:hypothetical protein
LLSSFSDPICKQMFAATLLIIPHQWMNGEVNVAFLDNSLKKE